MKISDFNKLVYGDEYTRVYPKPKGSDIDHLTWIKDTDIQSVAEYDAYSDKPDNLYSRMEALYSIYPNIKHDLEKLGFKNNRYKISEDKHFNWIILMGFKNSQEYDEYKDHPSYIYSSIQSLYNAFPNIKKRLGWGRVVRGTMSIQLKWIGDHGIKKLCDYDNHDNKPSYMYPSSKSLYRNFPNIKPKLRKLGWKIK